MSFIHQAKINNVNYDIIGSCYYGTSSTAAGTAAKVATVSNADGFVLVPGVQVAIKFTTANSASSPTLNVNSTGAKTVKYRGAAITSSTYYWGANQVVTFVYDGEAWQTTDYLKNPNSDTKATTTLTTTDGYYPVILKNTTTVTDSPTTTLRYGASVLSNPSTGSIKFNGETPIEINANDGFITSDESGNTTQLGLSGLHLMGSTSTTSIDTSGMVINNSYDNSQTMVESGAISTQRYWLTDSDHDRIADFYYDQSGVHLHRFDADLLFPNKNGTIATLNDIPAIPVPQKITLVATAGQTAFTIPFEYDSLSSNLTVYFNGILMKETDNYTVNTSNNTVNLAGFSAEAGDVITIMGLLGAQSIDFGQEAIDAINQINAAKAAAKAELNIAVNDAKNELNGAVQTAQNNINSLVQQLPSNWSDYLTKNASNTMGANGKITMSSSYTPSNNYDVTTKTYVDNKVTNLTTKTYVDNAISTATSNIVTDVFYTGSTADNNKKKLLWIDTGTSDPGLKYYNGSSWVTVPVRWS